MEFILEQIANFYKNEDILSLSWALIILSFIIILKFIFSNNIKYNDKHSEFNDCALKCHLEIQNDIFLYKNQKIDSIYLITSLNKLQYYNDNYYLNLLKTVTTYNIKNRIPEIEDFINQNITHIKKEQNYIINTNKINDLEKITSFFKNTNIKLFIESIFPAFLILSSSAFFLNLIIIIEEMNNFFYKTYSILFIVFTLFNISLLYFKIDDYINKKNYYFVSLIVVLNLTLMFIVIFTFKLGLVSEYPILKSILILLSSIISFIFSIKINYITSKFQNIKFNRKINLKELKYTKIKENLE